MHPDSGGRGLRGRRRDRHPLAEGRRGGLRSLHGDPRQGLRAARARQLQDLQAEGRRRGDRDRRPRGDPRALRLRRPGARARHAGAVGRRFGQHPRRAGHRREERLQTRARMGHGGAHPRKCGPHQGQAGRADRRVGRPAAAGQAAHDDPARRSDRVPGRGAHGLRTPHRCAAGALCRTRLQGVSERSGQPRAGRAALRRTPSGGADAARGGGPRQVGGGPEGGPRGSGRPVRRTGRRGGTRRSAGPRGGGGGRAETAPHGPHGAPTAIRSSKARSSCARRWQRSRPIPSSASIRRPRASTCSTTASWVCRSP